MRVWGGGEFLTPAERQRIHEAVWRILDETGVVVENDRLLERLASSGARVAGSEQRVTFSGAYMDAFLSGSDRADVPPATGRVGGISGVYFGHYLNPDTDEYEPWDTSRVLRYLKIAHHLENTTPFLSTIVPLTDVPADVLTPFYHYMTFKFLGRGACGMDDLRWMPCIVEMCEAAAAETNRPMRQFFSGYVFLISPLKLARQEADILEYAAEHALPLSVGHMTSAGGTGPVTLAGAVALHLAEEFVAQILHRVCFGTKQLSFGVNVSHIDMRTGIFPYGRPERLLAAMAMAAMAQFYGGRFSPPRSQSDAKRPSAEAGFQKGMAATAMLMACGSATVGCGVLSVDEVFSPIQMIIDNEMVGALKYLARGFEVDEDALAVDVIREVGPGGQFLDAPHTVEHFRQAVWEPQIFAREMFSGWRQGGSRIDADYARDAYHELAGRAPLPARISEGLERRLLDIVHKHTGRRMAPLQSF